MAIATASPPASADVPMVMIPIDRCCQPAARRAPANATVVSARSPRMPAAWAAAGDPAQRAAAEQMYGKFLAGFEQAVASHGLPRNDVAVAAAFFVTVGYRAYRGVTPSDAAFVAATGQLRDLLAATPEFTRADLARRQDFYETLALSSAVLLAGISKQTGNDTRAMGKAYLESLLRVDADRIAISDRGISLGNAAPQIPDQPTPPTPDATPQPPQPAPPTAGGLAPNRIAAILWKSELRYEAYPSNSMVMHEDDYLLLTDNTCTSRVPSDLTTFDAARSRAEHPKSWCTWRVRNGSYELLWPGGKQWENVGSMMKMRGGKRGERLAGTWSRSKTGTVGTASTWRGTTLVLRGDGTFEYTTAGAFTSNGDGHDRRDGEVEVSGSFDDEGSTSTISGDHVGGRIRNRTGRGAADRTGSYVIDGFAIELRYGSGKVERRMFAIAPGSAFVRLGGEMMPKR